MSRFRPLAVIAALALAACTAKDAKQTSSAASATGDTPVVATAPASSAEPTAEDISNYPLDMDKMRKWAATMKYLGEVAQSDPTVGDAVRMGNNESTAQTIAKLEANPKTRDALRRAGWSARDYVWTTAAYLQAGMTQGVLASTPGAKVPAGQSMKNVEFLRAHAKEIDQIASDVGRD